MKILASVSGIGMGHATRMFSVLDKLKRQAEIIVMSSDMSLEFMRRRGIKSVPLIDPQFTSESFNVDTFGSILDNLDFPVFFTRNYMSMSEVIDNFKPDIVICDTEPTAFIVSKLREKRLISVTNYIASLQVLDSLPKHLLNPGTRTQLYVMQKVVDNMVRYSKFVISPTFMPHKQVSEKIRLTELIIRKQSSELRSEHLLRAIVGEDFYLVAFGGTAFGKALFDYLAEALAKWSDRRFVLCCPYELEKPKEKGNVRIIPFTDRYLDYLKACKGVISLAGFSTISETISYRKPSLVIPIRNHIEQLLNAHMLDKLNLAHVCFVRENMRVVDTAIARFFAAEEDIRKAVERSSIGSNGAEQAAHMILSL